jgi:hypothetical protein
LFTESRNSDDDDDDDGRQVTSLFFKMMMKEANGSEGRRAKKRSFTIYNPTLHPAFKII